MGNKILFSRLGGYLEFMDADNRIILKIILDKYVVKTWDKVAQDWLLLLQGNHP
jgi:hypothetical protein